MNIKETRDILKALRAIAVRTVKNLQGDGKVSFFEGLGYISDFSEIKDAVVGAKHVGRELLDLDEEEIETLREDIRLALKGIGTSNDV
jgi:hypothetical protein